MKYPPLRTVTCKCDACLEESEVRTGSHQYDSVSQMVVCLSCVGQFEQVCREHEEPFNWSEVPESRINYDEREYEPDYDND